MHKVGVCQYGEDYTLAQRKALSSTERSEARGSWQAHKSLPVCGQSCLKKCEQNILLLWWDA